MAIVIAAAGAVVGYGVVGLAQGAAAIAMAFVFASVFYTPIMPLADAYALRGLGRLGRAYGPVRMWGSAAFIVGSFGAGVLLDVTAARDLIWLIVAAAVITAAVACALKPLGPHLGSAPQAGLSFAGGVWREPAFLAVAAAASLIQASHAVFYGFSALDWRAAGLDGAAIAALWALGVAAEIVLFAISGRLPIAPTTLLLIGAAGAVIRWGAMAFDPPAILLPALQCLHALSFGASHLGALGFIARTIPPKLGATAQGYLAVALGLAMAASMALAGVLYTRWGGLAYGAMALLAAAGGVCALAARRLASRGG
jgi:PPP family 3-phenylpropionic acid transporter